MIKIAVANRKGGSGKTTSSINLAAGLAIKGYKTLLVDWDTQANTTISYMTRKEISGSLANVFLKGPNYLPVERVIYETHLVNLDLIPADASMSIVEKLSELREQFILKTELDKLTDYDFIILDCPPSVGVPLTMAINACNYFLISVSAEYFPIEGANEMTEILKFAQQNNSKIQILGYLITRYWERKNISRGALEELKKQYGELVFTTVIHENVKLQEAPALRKSIFEYDPASVGCHDYLALVADVLERLGMNSEERVDSQEEREASPEGVVEITVEPDNTLATLEAGSSDSNLVIGVSTNV
jgi:chromosome partitioning protein